MDIRRQRAVVKQTIGPLVSSNSTIYIPFDFIDETINALQKAKEDRRRYYEALSRKGYEGLQSGNDGAGGTNG